ncbi:MAG: hypothetical protein ABIF71_03955 [Planctomycetota bacterium]
MLIGMAQGASISRSEGKSWSACQGVKGTGLGAVVDRTSPPANRVLFVGTAEGVWRSDDNGTTWTPKMKGLPQRPILSFAGGSDPKQRLVMLYCAVQAREEGGEYSGGVYRSRDRGET